MVKWFAASAGTLAYTDNEKGSPALIFMHGLPTSRALWQPVLPHLHASYRLITCDLHDYGDSQKVGRAISHQERAKIVDELRQHLGLESFILIGHDVGASVAIDFMGKFAASVSKLILISPPVYPDFSVPWIVRLARPPYLGEFLVTVMGDLLFRIGLLYGLGHRKRYTPELHQAFSQPFKGKEGKAALLRNLRWGEPRQVFQEYPYIFRQISVPTLIIHGQQDPYIPVVYAERLQRDIAGSQLQIIENGSHFLPIDTPKQVANGINRFLAEPI